MIESTPRIDRLLRLSSNPRGLKELLTSIFFEPGVTSNICGIWLRGSFAFLNTIKDPHARLRTFIRRDPELGGLWVGAFITGAHQCLRDARGASWKIDLNAAAWTDIFVSFIQEPVPVLASEACEMTRADESRLLYLCNDKNYTVPPLFPFASFGSTTLVDTNLDVREHALCGSNNCLGYAGFTWVCPGGTTIEQSKHDPPLTTIRPKYGQFSHYDVDVDIDDYAPIRGDARSTVGGILHGWILKTSTQRSNSM
ncbi:hypothetical protein B0T10DRAFT_463027 [Thelonectria olida]|uniref:Uncharacterized protein n=1 Tax=Thelonectria olida TaxID=1576542 RepID=A0A9P8W026_9HYPO|nr:hypothetical protein B0T10DRAFT_463027 [Thelonectria olida]